MPGNNNAALYAIGGAAVVGVGWYMEQGKTILGVTIPPFPIGGAASTPAPTTAQPTENLRLARAWTPAALAANYGITVAQLQTLNRALKEISRSPHAAVLTKGRVVVVPNPRYPGGVLAAYTTATTAVTA